jgi:hypothetical protein
MHASRAAVPPKFRPEVAPPHINTKISPNAPSQGQRQNSEFQSNAVRLCSASLLRCLGIFKAEN